MKLSLKTYKYLKSKHFFRTINCFFFFHNLSLTNKNLIDVKQTLATHNLKSFNIFNKITIQILKNSIFKNLIVLIRGPIIFLYTNSNKNLTFEILNTIHPLIYVLGLKLNNKIYSKKQIKNLKDMSFRTNFKTLYKVLKTWTKVFFYKLKKKSK